MSRIGSFLAATAALFGFSEPTRHIHTPDSKMVGFGHSNDSHEMRMQKKGLKWFEMITKGGSTDKLAALNFRNELRKATNRGATLTNRILIFEN